MWHATCTQANKGDSWLLVVKNQIGNLTLGPSFGHNLCFKYPNGTYEPILNIYIRKAFQLYKEIFNPMSFDPYNCPLRIQESIKTPTFKMGAYLGVRGFIPSHSPTLPGAWNVTPELHFWLAPLQALTLIMSPRLRLWQYIRLITLKLLYFSNNDKPNKKCQ
jgi:hypothetical protein